MKLKYIYLLFCVLGLVLPYSAFMPYVIENGFDLIEFLQVGFATPINSFLSWDLLLSLQLAILLKLLS